MIFRRYLWLLVMATGLLAPVRPSLAQEPSDKELKLTGQYLEFDHEKGVAVLKEGAYLEFDGLRLWGDNIHGDLRRSLFYASGDVTFWRGDERFSAGGLSYNTKTRRGTASDLKTAKGPAIISAKRLELEPYRMLGWDVSATTDASPNPRYRVDARKMIMIPRQKIIFRNAKFKFGERTVFRWPTYIINLANPEAVTRFFINPAWNPGKGFFLQARYDYFLADWFYGRIFFNPSQYQGTDYGINANYALGPSAAGQVNYTNTDTPSIGQRFQRYDLHHHWQILPTATFDLNSVLTDNVYTAGGQDRKLTINAVANKYFPDWNTSLSYDKLIDLNKDLAPGTDLFQYASQTPRFVFSKVRPVDLFGGGLPMRVDGAIAKIDERSLDPGPTGTSFSFSDITTRTATPREIDATKGELNLTFTPRPLTLLNDRSHVSYSFRDNQSAYSTGDLRNFFSFLVNTNERWTDHFSTGFDYVYGKAAGNTPFATFDRLEPERNLLTSYLRTNNGRWFSGTLFQTQYDIHNSLYTNASSNFVFRSPSQKEQSFALSFTPIYQYRDPTSFSSLHLDTIATNLQLTKPDRWSHTLITNFNYPAGRLESVATGMDFLVGETIRAELYSNAAYNPATGLFDITKLNLGLTKDLHAFEARLRWNTLQKEVYLEFYLKFAAKKRLQVGVNYTTEQLQFLNSDQVRQGFVN
jgi:hypothetical protein